MMVLIVLFVLLFLVLLLSTPLILEARARLGLRGAAIRAKLWLFGLIPVPLKLSVSLFSEPYFTLQFGRKRIPLLRRRRTGGEAGLLRGVTLVRAETVTTVGVAGDPADSVLLSGAIAVLLSMLTAYFAQSGTAKARYAHTSMLRIRLDVHARLVPLEMLIGLWKARRIAQAKAANNSPEINEKRNEYASC